MPSLPPIGSDLVRSPENRGGLPERFVQLFEQIREILRPVSTTILGTVDPEGVQTANQGDFFLNTSTNQLFVKTTEAQNTGWRQLT